jgi:DNA-binding transcriptional ArsR family regulator
VIDRMESVAEVHLIETLGQARAFLDPLRMRVATLLGKEEATAKQVADRLGEKAARVHYHVREMFKAGLVVLVRESPKGGILEKYYRAIARSFVVDPALLTGGAEEPEQKAPEKLGLATLTSIGRLIAQDAAALGAIEDPSARRYLVTLQYGGLWLTEEEILELRKEYVALLERYEALPERPDRHRYVAFFANYPSPRHLREKLLGAAAQ